MGERYPSPGALDRRPALAEILDAEDMAVPDPDDLNVELDESRLRGR
jgi:hypothetical protein